MHEHVGRGSGGMCLQFDRALRVSVGVTAYLQMVGRQVNGQSLQHSCQNILKIYKEKLMYMAKGAAQCTHSILISIFQVIISKNSKNNW